VSDQDWRTANRAHWDERVAVHLAPRGYNLANLRKGQGRLDAIVEAELPAVAGKRVLHLQCHIGADTLTLAQCGAEVVGLDFSAPAITAARDLSAELGLGSRARFVKADLYDALTAVPEPHDFDLVFVTWGAIGWLPDIRRWADIVAHFTRPGGSLYLAEGHPTALVFDERAKLPDGKPGYYVPYFLQGALVEDDDRDYADPSAVLTNTRQHSFMHSLGDVVTGLIEAGLTLDWLHEHAAVTWRMFDCLVQDKAGMYQWPDRPWLPLAYSLSATRRLTAGGGDLA
jgi:SAM-dependent methyltransferase